MAQIVMYSFDAAVEWPAGTVAVWVKADTVGQGNWNGVFSSHVPNSAGFQMDTDDGDPGNYRYNGVNGGNAFFGTVTTNWVHIAATTNSYTEETIVHGGSKSMPLAYDNSVFRYSEVEMMLSYPRDWTEEGVGVLSLWFYGDAANADEPVYVALNGSAVVSHGNPNAVLIDEWNQWNIDLQEFADQGVNLANVNTIALGFGNRNNPQVGGAGKMYFDDIQLRRPLQEPEPEPAP